MNIFNCNFIVMVLVLQPVAPFLNLPFLFIFDFRAVHLLILLYFFLNEIVTNDGCACIIVSIVPTVSKTTWE